MWRHAHSANQPGLNESPELIAQEYQQRLRLPTGARRLNESPELIAQESPRVSQRQPVAHASMKVLSLLLRNVKVP